MTVTKLDVQNAIDLIKEAADRVAQCQCDPPIYSVYVTTRTTQNRRHKKRRIDRKWLKRYGVTEYEMQTEPVIVDQLNRRIYCQRKFYDKILKGGTNPWVRLENPLKPL